MMTTVAVCTFNRAPSLRRTLASFSACRVPAGFDWELLVVDNASTDGTRGVVGEFESVLPIRSLCEPTQGLSHARNRAVAESAGSRLLVFTDDDVRVEPDWIAAYARAADARPEADFFGGRVKPLFEGGRPRWLADENMDLLDGLFVNYDPGAVSREILPDDLLPVGASMGFRPSCFAGGNLFRTDLGVCGRNRGRGEDTEFMDRLLRFGRRGHYIADALSHHEVAPERLTFRYAFRYGIACGRSAAASGGSPGKPGIAPLRASLFLLRGIRQLAIGRGDRARQCAIRAGMELANYPVQFPPVRL
jgi:glycosyltransferase involved in cell wall biosynthesis